MASAEIRSALWQLLKEMVAKELVAAKSAHVNAMEGVTHADSKAEGDKDTRATEASYIARGFAKRIQELSAQSSAMDRILPRTEKETPVNLGTLVSLRAMDGTCKHVLLSPAGAGLTLSVRELPESVAVTSQNSPLAKALIGSFVDDEIVVVTPDGKKSYEIVGCW